MDDESYLRAETKLLLSEIKHLEQEDKSLVSELEEKKNKLEIKNKTKKQLMKSLLKLKEKISNFISEDDTVLYQTHFLESERNKLLNIQKSLSEKYDNNMIILEDLMKSLDFMKGEIGMLRSKSEILESEIPFKFKNSENLDKKVKTSFFRALHNLQKGITDVQKKIEAIYYKRGEF